MDILMIQPAVSHRISNSVSRNSAAQIVDVKMMRPKMCSLPSWRAGHFFIFRPIIPTSTQIIPAAISK